MRFRSVVLVALLALAGCAGSPPQSPPAPTATPTPAASSSSPSAGLITVTGRVRAGVEAGCLVLRADGKDYLLLGGTAAQRAALGEGRVTVHGQLPSGVASTCMQGTPLLVLDVHRG